MISRNVTAFKKRNFYLIHGTADGTESYVSNSVLLTWEQFYFSDNVHFQNSAVLAKALTAANIQFDFMVCLKLKGIKISVGPIPTISPEFAALCAVVSLHGALPLFRKGEFSHTAFPEPKSCVCVAPNRSTGLR